jgi:hypothetical protein
MDPYPQSLQWLDPDQHKFIADPKQLATPKSGYRLRTGIICVPALSIDINFAKTDFLKKEYFLKLSALRVNCLTKFMECRGKAADKCRCL